MGKVERIYMHQRGQTVSCSEGFLKELTREEIKKCVGKLENRKAAGADQKVN